MLFFLEASFIRLTILISGDFIHQCSQPALIWMTASNTPGLYHFKFPIEVNVIFAGWVSQPKTWRAGLVAKEKMAA